jgi:hypothetical protein
MVDQINMSEYYIEINYIINSLHINIFVNLEKEMTYISQYEK